MSVGVACPNCGDTASAVTDCRPSIEIGGAATFRRRRICAGCKGRFTTYEVSQEVVDRIEAFLSDKSGLRSALESAIASLDQADAFADATVQFSSNFKENPSASIPKGRNGALISARRAAT